MNTRNIKQKRVKKVLAILDKIEKIDNEILATKNLDQFDLLLEKIKLKINRLSAEIKYLKKKEDRTKRRDAGVINLLLIAAANLGRKTMRILMARTLIDPSHENFGKDHNNLNKSSNENV